MPGNDDSDKDVYDMSHSMRQLWSTQIHDMRQYAASKDDVGHCVCCVRPILATDPGTRKMTFSSLFVDILHNSVVDQTSLLYNEQCRVLRTGHARKFILVCFICLPSWKKSITQHESRRTVETPSLFMHKSNAFIQDSTQKTDKLSLLKYVLCATSEVVIADSGEKLFHPMRTTDYVVLEAIIVFFKGLFLKHNYNVRVFSRMFCHFQIVSIVRWHVAGFPLIMTQNRQTQDLRKALRGEIGKLYHQMWGFADDLTSIQVGLSKDKNMVCTVCAACVHKQALSNIDLRVPSHSLCGKRTSKQCDLAASSPRVVRVSRTESALSKSKTKRNSYDTFFLKDWKYIHENIAHTTALSSDETGVMPGHAITCRHRLEQSVVSYEFYRKISHRFPKKFRQRNMRRYYSRLMRDGPLPLLPLSPRDKLFVARTFNSPTRQRR